MLYIYIYIYIYSKLKYIKSIIENHDFYTKHTKNYLRCIDAILDGSIEKSKFSKDPVFGFEIPRSLGSVPSEILNPRNAWKDQVHNF